MAKAAFRRIASHAVCALACTAAAAATAQDAGRWLALLASAPPPPASLPEARERIAVHRLGDRVVVEASDAALAQRRRDADALRAPPTAAAAAQIKATFDAIEKDPQTARLANRVKEALDDSERVLLRGERRAVESSDPEVASLLREMQKPRDLSSLSPIARFRLEQMRARPGVNGLKLQLIEQRRRYAQGHAEVDVAPAADAAARRERVQRHQALAQQQLEQARTLHAAARDALRPAIEHMVLLAAEAERRGASPIERTEAYAWLHSVFGLFDSIARATTEDVGFWAAVRPADAADPRRSGYVLAPAPEVDLRADGTLPPQRVPYPAGRVSAPGAPR